MKRIADSGSSIRELTDPILIVHGDHSIFSDQLDRNPILQIPLKRPFHDDELSFLEHFESLCEGLV